jgi:hypothetical protein
VVSQAADEQAFADVPDSEGEQTPTWVQQGGSAAPSLEVAASPTLIRRWNLQPIYDQNKDEETTSSTTIKKGGNNQFSSAIYFKTKLFCVLCSYWG